MGQERLYVFPCSIYVLWLLLLHVEGVDVAKLWVVHWVPGLGRVPGGLHPVLDRWGDLAEREAGCQIDPGDPFMTDPVSRVDVRLTLYFTRSSFARLRPETKRNYATDCCLFFNFLWGRGRTWSEATADDVLDFEDWRRWSPRNPRRIGGAKWNRELAALSKLYRWAVGKKFVGVNPILVREVRGWHGQVVTVAAAKAKDVRSSDVKWLTPRAFRLWRDVGLRGYTSDGRRDPGWSGRNDDRNAAYADLLFSTGMRRTEGASLLTLEVPELVDHRRFYDARLAGAASKSKKPRTVYISVEALRATHTYCQTMRRAVIRRAQRLGRYDQVEGMQLVTRRSGHRQTMLHWTDAWGNAIVADVATLTAEDRQKLFFQGGHGVEPLWLWLAEDGMPFQPHSWESVFRAGSQRCQRVLAGKVPHPPFMTPHMARHSFALHMLVALHHAMDERFDLTPEQRREFEMLYRGPWRMVQDLLGHSSVETTRSIYLAPVSDLQIRSLLVDEDKPSTAELLHRLVRASSRILDSEDVA